MITQHLQRITLKRLHAALWHRKWIVFKINLAGFGIFLIDREINDPGKGETLFIRQAQFIANHHPGLTSNPLKGFRFTAQEECRIADAKPQLLANGLCTFGTYVFGQRPCGLHAFALVAPEDIAHARQAFFLGKSIHAVTEFSAATFRSRNSANFRALLLQELCENGKTRASKMLRNHLHLNRVAQIWFVAAIPKGRITIADLLPCLIHFATAAKLFEYAGQDRLYCVKNILLIDKRHF